jgi:two-component system, OmpR family, sensor kinase
MALETPEMAQPGYGGATIGAREKTSRRARAAGWLRLPRSARARIVASLILVLALLAVPAILGLRQVLLIRVEDQVNDALEQEVRELDRLQAGLDPETARPFETMESLFDVYLRRNVPSNDEALLTFVDGAFYRSLVGRFPLERLPAETLTEWEQLSGTIPGEAESATGHFQTELGTGYFRANRVRLGDDTGAFVVTILPQEELTEIEELERYGAFGTVTLLLLAAAGAWFITGRVLAPVRQLTATAEAISRSDLTRRIPVTGTDEAADMGRSFNAMLDRLEAVFRSQRAFVADASHELRDPLTICSGHLELLGDDPDERRRTVALVMDELDRMGRIVDDLQVLADAEQPDFLQPEAIDLAPFSHELSAKAGALADRHWRLDSSAQDTIIADRHRLTEAVMNLAHNAVQHTDQDDTIAIGSSVTDGEVRLWVRDTGAGIQPADRERIFERFTRGKGAHRRYRGSGLGLAIVKAIAEAHGGRVELASEPGLGSTFTIVIPSERSGGAENGPDTDS